MLEFAIMPILLHTAKHAIKLQKDEGVEMGIKHFSSIFTPDITQTFLKNFFFFDVSHQQRNSLWKSFKSELE